MVGYKVFDVETTIKNSFKRKANPFDEDNWVVYLGVQVQDCPSAVRRFASKEHTKGWFAQLLHDNPKMIVGFNIKFDILHAIAKDEENLKAWMKWVADGGVVWDCQLAEYLLGGMLPELQMLSLDEVAPKYGGSTKVDEVKALWQAGVDTPDIPEDLITEYLHGDCENTTKIFLGQMKRARECGQVKHLLLNFGSLCYTIEAERNGMFVDKELGLQLADELLAERDELDARLNEYLPKDLPFEFKWSSRHQLSPLIFGGHIKYESRQYDLKSGETTFVPPTDATRDEYKYAQKEEVQYLKTDGTTTLDPSDSDIAFVQSGKNAGSARTKKVRVDDYDKPKGRQAERLYELQGFTEPDKSWASSTPGLYSVAAEVIEALGNRDIPFLQDLRRRAAVAKDLGTYFITTDPETGEQKGMLTLVQPDSIIHHSINHTSTVTGRFSSSSPNLQNIPKGGKSKVKQVFKSRYKDGKIIQSDFTALEIYIQAILTGDKQLIQDLIDGLDMHCARVATTYGVDYDMVKLAVKAEEAEGFPGEKVWTGRRTKAKVFSFQRAYGAGAALIALSTGMPREEVDALIEAECKRYPQIEPFYANLMKIIEASKRGVRKVIPHPDYPAKQVELRTGYYRTPDNCLYAYIEQPSPKYVVDREGKWTGFSPTEIKNYIVQGEGASWAKAAMWLAVRAYYKLDNFKGRALLVNQVHDACYADADPSVSFEAAACLHACMEGASELMETYFGWPIPVSVPSETKWGPSMADEYSIEGVKERAVAYREFLTKTFIKAN